jgi:hypothetical protein
MQYLFGKYPVIVGNLYELKGSLYEYVGEFMHTKDPAIPHKRCCYSIGDKMYRHTIEYVAREPPKPDKKRRDADDRPIDTTVRDSDNTLMVLAKQVIKGEDITHNEFKELFESPSDFNNFLRQIERCDNLSFNRFTELLDRLGLEYDLNVYKPLPTGRELVGGKE